MGKPGEALKDFFRQHELSEVSVEWQQWLDLKERDSKDLENLLAATVRPEFKKRAIAILLAPDFNLLPKGMWKWGPHGLTNMLLFGINIYKRPEDLRVFTGELILGYSAIVYATPDTSGAVYVPLRVYQSIIVQFLCLLNPSDLLAERLFSAYLFNDYHGFRPDGDGNFSPLRHFLKNEKLSEEWKRRGDLEMRKIIDAEAKDIIKEAYDRRALSCYVLTIQCQLWQKTLQYSRDLLADQIEFLLNLPIECDWGSFFHFSPRDVLKFLGGTKYKELRHRYAQRAFSVVGNHFLDGDDRMALKAVLQEFSDDVDLCERIQGSIAAQREDAEQEKKQAAQSSEVEETALNAMR